MMNLKEQATEAQILDEQLLVQIDLDQEYTEQQANEYLKPAVIINIPKEYVVAIRE